MSGVPGEPATLIVSDLHLGQPGRSPDAGAFAPLFAGFERVVVNGDAAEVQVPELRVAAARQLERLRGVAEAAGAELVLIAGNHDAFLTDRRRLSLLGGRVLVTHGDVLHPAIAPWSSGAAEMRRDTAARLAAWREATVRSRDAEPDADTLLEIARHVSHGEFLRLRRGEVASPLRRVLWWSVHPRRFLSVLHYWRTVPARAAAFAELAQPEAEVVVIGHSHRAGVWRVGGRTVLNTGSYPWPGKPHAVVVRSGGLAFHRVVEGAGGFELDPEVLYMHAGAGSKRGREIERE